VKYTSIQDKVV